MLFIWDKSYIPIANLSSFSSISIMILKNIWEILANKSEWILKLLKYLLV